MKNKSLVSIIIPTYNRARIVSQAINSVLEQTYQNIEIVVVDDGSTDDTASVLQQYGTKIRVVQQKNSGPAIARNRGIAVASGDIIAFLDSDDAWVPTKLERQVELLEKAGPAVPCCLCNCGVVYQDGRKTSTFAIADTMPACPTGLWLNPAEVLLTRFVLFNQAVAIRREVLERVGYFDENLRFGEDYDLPLRLAFEGPWVIIRDELVIYHASSDGSWAEKALREEVRLREDLLHMRQQIARRMEGDLRHVRLQSLSHRELQRAKRDLFVARLARGKFSGSAGVSRLLRFVERMRRGLFRRSPSYPRMLVEPLR